MNAAAAEVATPALSELLARIKPVKRREETYLCLRPDLLDQWTAEQKKLGEMQTEKNAGMHDRLAAAAKKKANAAITAQAKVVQELEDQIEATQVKFVVEKMGTPEWNALVALHPPRKDNIVDHAAGYNRDAVSAAAVRMCLVEPVVDSDEAYDELLNVLGPSEWEELRSTTERANGKVVQAPKSELAAVVLTGANSSRSRQRNGGG